MGLATVGYLRLLETTPHSGHHSVPELTNLGAKQHPMNFVFPLSTSKFTMDFPLTVTGNINHLQQLRGTSDSICPSTVCPYWEHF